MAIGIAVAVLAQEYRIGTSARMGPGYFPTLLGGLMTLLGLTLTVPAFFIDGDRMPVMQLRPLAMILLGVAAFGVTLEYFGFVAAVIALVVVGGLADRDLKPLEIAGTAAFMALFSTLIFVLLLGLPLRLWPDL